MIPSPDIGSVTKKQIKNNRNNFKEYSLVKIKLCFIESVILIFLSNKKNKENINLDTIIIAGMTTTISPVIKNKAKSPSNFVVYPVPRSKNESKIKNIVPTNIVSANCIIVSGLAKTPCPIPKFFNNIGAIKERCININGKISIKIIDSISVVFKNVPNLGIKSFKLAFSFFVNNKEFIISPCIYKITTKTMETYVR